MVLVLHIVESFLLPIYLAFEVALISHYNEFYSLYVHYPSYRCIYEHISKPCLPCSTVIILNFLPETRSGSVQ